MPGASSEYIFGKCNQWRWNGFVSALWICTDLALQLGSWRIRKLFAQLLSSSELLNRQFLNDEFAAHLLFDIECLWLYYGFAERHAWSNLLNIFSIKYNQRLCTGFLAAMRGLRACTALLLSGNELSNIMAMEIRRFEALRYRRWATFFGITVSGSAALLLG